MIFRTCKSTFPLAFVLATALVPCSLGWAAEMDATAAASLLSKSRAIDAKCSILAKDQSQALRNFVAQAEISLAGKVSVAEARKAMAAGKIAGQSAQCDDAAKKLVNDVLAAASAATKTTIDDSTSVAQAPVTPPAPQPVMAAKVAEVALPVARQAMVPAAPVAKPVIAKPVVAVKPAAPVKAVPAKVAVKPVKSKVKVKVATVALPVIAKPAKPVKPAATGRKLAAYASVAEKYYVAMRCGSMSSGRINSLYQVVLADHKQAMATSRRIDVRNMLRAAESRAAAKSCG